jgi:serine/threonine protein kinase/putative intracellular protease/amidase
MNPSATLPHPTAETLRAFGLGQLTGAAQAVIEQHVAQCEHCCAVLAALPNDTFIETLQRGQRQDETLPVWSAVADAGGSRDTLRIPAELVDHPRYRILRQLGAGGMGVVYQAEHRMMQRQVALKVISRELMRRSSVVERFRHEVRAAGRLSHPNIVTSYDAEQAGELHFLVMEFVDGVNLFRQVEKGGPLPIKHACNFIRQAAAGLQHAMEQGMVHRDIKPHNLMLTRDMRVKILDFGLSRFGQASLADDPTAATPANPQAVAALTAVGAALGTPDYIAPEQADDSSQCDIRADIYALGCTLFYLLTGRPPFASGSALERIEAHRSQSPPSLRVLRADVPAEVEQIVQRMLAKAPSARFQEPREVAEALQAWSRGTSPPVVVTSVATKPRSTHRAVRGSGRSRWVVGATLLMVIGAIVAAAVQFSSRGPTNNNTPAHVTPTPPPLAVTTANAPNVPPAAKTATKVSDMRLLFVVPFDNFWYQDYAKVSAALSARDIRRVSIASTKIGRCMPSLDNRGPVESVTSTLTLEQAQPEQFDAVVFIGAHPLAETALLTDARQSQLAQSFAKRMLAERKLVTGICGGVAILAQTGVLRDYPATYNQFIPQPLRGSSGVRWNYQRPVISLDPLPIITARDENCAVELVAGLSQSFLKLKQ